jgi:hypothetical protein
MICRGLAHLGHVPLLGAKPKFVVIAPSTIRAIVVRALERTGNKAVNNTFLRALIGIGLLPLVLLDPSVAQRVSPIRTAEQGDQDQYSFPVYRALEDTKRHSSTDVMGLLHRVNIGANDRRTSISDYSAVFLPKTQANLARISGRVICRIGDYNYTAEARLIEDGRQIITNAHALSEEDGQPISDPLPRCHFITTATPKKKIPLDFREGFYYLGTRDPWKDKRNDFALVRLKEAITNVTIPKIGAAPNVGETVYMVSHKAEGASRSIDHRQLVAQDCTVWFFQRGDEMRLGYFVTDCSSVRGDSGSSYYALRNGGIELVGFEQGGGFASANGRPYDVSNPDPKLRSFSLGLTFDQRLLEESRSLAERANGSAKLDGRRRGGN